MRTVEEIENDIKECSATGTQKQLDEYWLEWFRTVAQGIEPERLREICAAEKDKRCVVLPCKVGDTVYKVNKASGKVSPWRVNDMYFTPKMELHIMAGNNGLCLTMADFGKTIFFDRPEAEAKLAAMKEVHQNE